MLTAFQAGGYDCRFFDRFDDEARAFEDRLRAEPMLAGAVPWPRVSFWQGYRHLQTLSSRWFVLQMSRPGSTRRYQIAVVERTSRIPWFKTGQVRYWIPATEPEAAEEQAELLKILRALCRKHTALMSLRVHAYVPGDDNLAAAEKLLRESGFSPCEAQAPARTRLIDLSPSIDEILARFPAKTRAFLRIKKPEEARVEELRSRAQIPDLQAALDDSFQRSSDRGQAYDFEGLFDALEKSPESAVAYGFFFSDDAGSPKAFVTGAASLPLFEFSIAGSRSDARLRRLPFNYILLWRLVEAAKERGALVFDMGGITDGGPEDPLAGISYFKRRFPGTDVGVGREALLELRPAACRLFSALRSMKGLLRS